MGKFSDLVNIEIPKKHNDESPFTNKKYLQESIENLDQVSSIRDCIREIAPIINSIKMECAAIESLQSNSDFTGIIDIISKGDVDGFHKRLGITNSDLFGRSDKGKRDIYVSSLTEDVTNFISQLWDAVRSAIQKVYDWSMNLVSENSKIAICKQQVDAAIQAMSTKGNATVTCDMCDVNDWEIKANQILKLYTVLEELFTTATQSIVTGQLNENMLQDQLVGKMQRNNIIDIKLVITDGVKSSSFVFQGIGTGRIEVTDAGTTLTNCKQMYDSIIAKIGNVNNAIATYAQNITAAQSQYKCNTDCAAVVSNISSATQLITKAVVSINNYVTETLTNCLMDIASKINMASQKLPDQQPSQNQPEQEPVKIKPVEEPQQVQNQ